MNRHHRNFSLALILFFAWVGGLALMAGYSGERPRLKSEIAVTR